MGHNHGYPMVYNHGAIIKHGTYSVLDQYPWYLISIKSNSMDLNQCRVKIYGSNSVLEFRS